MNHPKCVRWDFHQSQLQTSFTHQLKQGRFCDLTIACDGGETLKAHRSILCACSGYFDSVLIDAGVGKDTLVILKDCDFREVSLIIEFMYNGEICVDQVSCEKDGVYL